MSNYTKTMICLATSKKDGGRCVAGKSVDEVDRGQWIRPVSPRVTAEISLEERRYQDGSEPRLLDVIQIPMMAPVPRGHQTENHLIDGQEYWIRNGSATWADLLPLLDKPATLWANESSSTAGTNDRITPATAATLTNSLWLIKPQKLTIQVCAPGAAFGNPKRKVRASFQYNGTWYDFSVTDLAVEADFLTRPDGDYKIDQEVYLCASLGEAHTDPHGNTFCYKLVAAIFSQQPL